MMKSKKEKMTKLNLDEELLREAAEIEEEIKNVPLEENPVDKERLRSAILMQVLQEERKKQQKRSARRRIAQGAAVFAVTMTGIFGLSMTSQANRIFLVQKVEEFFSGRTDVKVDNEDGTVISSTAEQQAREEIEEKLNVNVPEFYYLPENVFFSGFQIFEDVAIAEMYYEFYNGKIITFCISNNDEDSTINRSFDGELINKYITKIDQLEIEIWEMSNDTNEEKAYSAQWVYRNAYYYISGTMPLDEMEKILNSMIY